MLYLRRVLKTAIDDGTHQFVLQQEVFEARCMDGRIVGFLSLVILLLGLLFFLVEVG